MLTECLQAANTMADILEKLQQTQEYRTEPYLPAREGQGSHTEAQILAI